MMNSKPYTKKKLSEKNQLCASSYGLPTPTEENILIRQTQIDEMKLFFATAPHQWDTTKSIKRFNLPNGEAISCVLWDNLFFISGTDIVRSLTFRFHAFGRPVMNHKKFEEGIFSDLRNLKPGHDARLEEPKSELLDMLYKNNCIRTQKKQKVFYWFSVPHDRLFLDALERDLKREKMGLESTTRAIVQPATSLSLDSTQDLFDELRKNMSIKNPNHPQVTPKNDLWSTRLDSGLKRSRVHSLPNQVTHKLPLTKPQRISTTSVADGSSKKRVRGISSTSTSSSISSSSSSSSTSTSSTLTHSPTKTKWTQPDYLLDPISSTVNRLDISSTNQKVSKSLDLKKQKALFGNLHLLDGSPSYKQRRRRTTQSTPSPAAGRVHRHANCHHPTPVKNNFSRVSSFGLPPPLKSSSPTMTTKNQSRLALAAYKAGLVQSPDSKLNDVKPVNMTSVDINWHEPQIKSETQESILCCQQLMPSCQHLLNSVDNREMEMMMFTCQLCGKMFSESQQFEEHQRMEHSEDRMEIKQDDNDDDEDHLHSPPKHLYSTISPFNLQTDYHSTDSSLSTHHWRLIGGDIEMQEPTDNLFSVYDQVYDPILSATSSTHSLNKSNYYEQDDFSTSTMSSPSDPFHSMTLFSPFKPMLQDQEEQDLLPLDSIYAYIDPSIHLSYPFDMNFVFGA
ncbi:hypothetical protein G6F42_016715 [Rhizopus arrhizus]|nr:hypothetical protein G6F42_016715 [Rhizopus arrhizus]